MTKVLPLSRWKKHKQPVREEFSDEDSDEISDGEEEPIEIPLKKRRLVKPDDQKKKRKKRKIIRIPKYNPRDDDLLELERPKQNPKPQIGDEHEVERPKQKPNPRIQTQIS